MTPSRIDMTGTDFTPQERLHWAEWDYYRACADGLSLIIGKRPSWYSGGMWKAAKDDFGSQSKAAFDNEDIADTWTDAALDTLVEAQRMPNVADEK